MIYQGFKGYFHQLFPPEFYKTEVYLEGHLEREVFRRLDRSDPTQLEILSLPENGTYQQLLQIRIKHPQSPALNRLQNIFLVSPITIGTGFYTHEHAQEIGRLLKIVLSKGWQETLYFKEKDHVLSIIEWEGGQKWHYRLAEEKLSIQKLPMSLLYSYYYRFLGYQPRENSIEPNFLT